MVIGDEMDVRTTSAVLKDLLGMVREGHTPTVADVHYVLDEASGPAQEDNGNRNTVVKAAFRTDIPVRPRTRGQREYVETLQRCELTLAIGPAGTGKTFLAMAAAVSALLNKQVKRLIFTRPAVEAGESLGFLPGDLIEKVNPYLRPLYDALYAMVDAERVQRLIETQRVEVAPLAFMRGRTLHDAYVILDEAQNTTTEQMKMFLTRIGQGSRTVITGDVTQGDLPAGRKSGLEQAMTLLKGIPGIGIVHLSTRDVVRNPLVQRIVEAYEIASAMDAQNNPVDETKQ